MTQEKESIKEETPRVVSIKLMSLEQVIWRLDYILSGLYSFIEKMYISEETVCSKCDLN